MVVYEDQVDNNRCRWIRAEGRKYFFVSDLQHAYGKKTIPPQGHASIKWMRVLDNGNSQERRLISAKDYTTYNRKDNVPVKKKAVAKKRAIVKLKVLQTRDLPRNVAKKVKPLDEVRDNFLKNDVMKLCKRYSNQLIAKRKLTRAAIEASDRWVYRESYRTIYHEFDRIMAQNLARDGHTLKDVGLGYANKKAGTRYIDTITAAGLMTVLHTVTQSLYGKIE